MAVDVLVVAAHPDDAELAAGGLIAVSVAKGHSVGIVDLTQGELGSRGTAAERREESAAADVVLSISVRENLGLPDGSVAETPEARRMVAEAIRKHRPTLVAAPYVEDLHPDHAAAGRLVEQAFYPSGFTKYETPSAPYRPAGLVHYMNHYPFTPSFVLDVTAVWETRIQAVKCYRSQLHDPDSDGPKTGISSPEFLDRLEARFRYFGSLVGVTYGEPYWTRGPVRLSDPLTPFRSDS